MTRCLKCGSSLAPHARFCSVCGNEVVAASPQNTNATQSFNKTQGIGTPGAPNPNQTQMNQTQGFYKTAAFQSGEMNPTTAFSQGGYGPGGPDPNAEAKKRMMIVGGSVAALVLIAGLIFVSASGILGAKKPDTAGAAVLSAPPTQMAQAPILAAPAPSTAPAPVLTAPENPGTPMPADVIDYLRWLKQYEKGRIALEAKSEAQMMLVLQEIIKVSMVGTSGMGLLDGDPEEASKNKDNTKSAIDMQAINAVIQDWNQATGIFQAKRPPESCATIASNYNEGLSGSVSSMTSILGSAVRAVDSINKAGGEKTQESSDVLTSLKDQHSNNGLSQNIEASFNQSNQALDALRSQYTNVPDDISKAQFSIKSGGTGGLNIPIPGLGM